MKIGWIDPDTIPKNVLPMNSHLEVFPLREKDEKFLVETFGDIFKFKTNLDSAFGWLQARYDVEAHHDSDGWCLLICCKGSGVLETGDYWEHKKIPMCAGTYTFFNASQVHAYRSFHKSKFIVVPVKRRNPIKINDLHTVDIGWESPTM